MKILIVSFILAVLVYFNTTSKVNVYLLVTKEQSCYAHVKVTSLPLEFKILSVYDVMCSKNSL